jgi:GNAT superfamily N-acetyltransferase
MLGIECEQGEVYGLDMLIAPDYRGKKLAVPLQLYSLKTLKLDGYNKIYGYYWEDNIPAMRFHRRLKYKELTKRRVSQFFFYEQSENVK